MTPDELTDCLRAELAGAGEVREVRMFGGVGFMLNGNMVAAASKRGLLLRVGKANQSAALATAGASLMTMRGRTMEGYVFVDPAALSPGVVSKSLPLALAFVRGMAPKTSAGGASRKNAGTPKRMGKQK
jgi:TfoX/Sxy family transcriptional regulator of competence genes